MITILTQLRSEKQTDARRAAGYEVKSLKQAERDNSDKAPVKEN